MKRNEQWINRMFRSLVRLCGFVAAAGLVYAPLGAAPEKRGSALAGDDALLVVVDDLLGEIDPSADYVREDLLQNAFYDAARRNEWLGEFTFEYNHTVAKDARGYLRFNIIDWEQTRSGFFEISLSASFTDADGKTLDLGTFHGMRSGIAVTTGRDVAEHFSDVAQDAFEDALKRLKKETLGEEKAEK